MQVAPSILSADFAHMEREVEWLNRSEADWLHFDVMDGSFVPNISFGFPVMASLKKAINKPFDVHLMVVRPEQWVDRLAQLGARMMTVHQEVSPNLHRTIQQIHEAGMLAGVAINPATPISVLEEVIKDIDLVLIMTVNPGFGGQKFISSMLDKVRRMKEMIVSRGGHALIECDGGVNLETGRQLKEAGVDILVTGNTAFKAPDPVEMVRQLKNL
ncbi:MAG: ribulose-phosphate 3-epimerase [Bacteroidales bacterium]|nr:ribulose-phosphate 3-epimerase [Bacteroidales bacterium]